MRDVIEDMLGGIQQGANFTSMKGGDTTSAPTDDGKKTLEELKKMFDDFRSTQEANRMQGLIDYDYYDGKQLTPEEVAKLRSRGQPDIVVNRTRVAINGIMGIIARSNTDPKAWPRSPTENDSASVATDCLRFVMEKADFNRIKVEQAKDNFVGGCNAVVVGLSGDKNVPITRVEWSEFFYDPRSRRLDFADARYLGIAKWMYSDDVQTIYPETADDMSIAGGASVIGISGTDESFTDRPINQGWLDYRNKRFMVVEIYYRAGAKWYKAVFWYSGVLEQDESPYLDEFKNSACPIIAESCYIDRDNNRYGIVRDMRDLQDEINKRRSKLLHLINSSQIQARDPSAIEVDADTARSEAARPDGVLPFGWEKVSTTDMAQGQALLLTEAKNEMERFGPNPAVLGRQGADTSGRALLARQQAGLVELAVVLDQLENWELRVYRAAWCRIQQSWTAPQYIRVVHDINAPEFVGINEPIPNPQAGQPMIGSNGVQMQTTEGAPAVYPATLGYKNSVADMDVDIVIDTAPATASIMQEQVKDLMDLVSSNPAYSEQIPFEIFLELMPIPRKSQIMAKVATAKKAQQEQSAQTQQMQIKLAVEEAMAKIGKLKSQSSLDDAKADNIRGDTVHEAVNTHGESAERLHDMHLAGEASTLERYRVVEEAAARRAEANEAPEG